jgi:hypothetical protein
MIIDTTKEQSACRINYANKIIFGTGIGNLFDPTVLEALE